MDATILMVLLIPLLGRTAHQDFALAGVVGLPDDAFVLHPLHDRGRPIVADLQAPLNVAGRRLLIAQHDLHRLLIEIGGVAGRPNAGRIEHRAVLVVLVATGGATFAGFRGAPRAAGARGALALPAPSGRAPPPAR